MQTHVYANDLEIAAKAVDSDGVSPQAFPDPCWSPPAPTAGPVVIPYPNTCFAQSITNGTGTVFIAGKEVAIEDVSRFSTSIGNEPATQAFAKGVATGVITGKAYFTQWSFDVIFESFGVPRHQDLVSHNHGSMPSNTPVFPYLSRRNKNKCKTENDRIEEECKEEKESSEHKKEIKKKSKLSTLLKSKRKTKDPKKKDYHWTDDHCDGLEVKIIDADAAKEQLENLKDVYKSLPEELNLLQALKSELQDMAVNAAGKAAAKFAVKTGVKQAAGSVVPLAGNIVMGLWSVYDAAVAIGDVNEIRQVANSTLEQLDVLEKKFDDIKRLGDKLNKGNLTPDEIQSAAVEGQEALATLNNCVRARKCNLVPHTQNDNTRGVETAKTGHGGCCNGQTGHHLVSGAAMKEACTDYKHETAPTVCVEGTSQHFGSHKRVHEKYAETTAAATKNAEGRMSMADTLDAAAESHVRAFPLSRCSKACILAQLKGHYDTHCANSKVLPGDKNGNPIKPAGGSNNG
jgi:Domain of unknown function (DUF4150)